ncbi:MAG: tetratricopeptide repeat protein [Cyanobacteria bacterium]|nr:tetratricopeptide repeat protein [Cyanobacteriota bacterium]
MEKSQEKLIFSNDDDDEGNIVEQQEQSVTNDETSKALSSPEFCLPEMKSICPGVQYAENGSKESLLTRIGADALTLTGGLALGFIISKHALELYLGQVAFATAFGFRLSLAMAVIEPICLIPVVVTIFNLLSRFSSNKNQSLLFKNVNLKRQLMLFAISMSCVFCATAVFWMAVGQELSWSKKTFEGDPFEINNEQKAAELMQNAPTDRKAEAVFKYAQALSLNDKRELAEKYYMQVLSMSEKQPEMFMLYASTLNSIAWIEELKGNFDKAIEFQQKTIKVLQLHNATSEPSPFDVKGSLFSKEVNLMPLTVSGSIKELGNIYFRQGKFQEAETNYKKALSMALNLESSYLDIIEIMESYGKLMKKAKRASEIGPLYLSGVGTMIKHEDSVHHAVIYEKAGGSLGQLGQYDEAIKFLKKGLAVESKNAYLDHREDLHEKLGATYLKKKEFVLARKEFQEQLEYVDNEIRKHGDSVKYKRVKVLEHFASVCMAESKLDEAEDHYKKCLSSIREDKDWRGNSREMEMLEKLAMVSERKGDLKSAEKYYLDSIAIGEKRKKSKVADSDLADSLFKYSNFLKNAGRRQESDKVEKRSKQLAPDQTNRLETGEISDLVWI